jgi:PEP-CTERM motif
VNRHPHRVLLTYLAAASLWLVPHFSMAQQAYKDQVGYTQLVNEFGASLATGDPSVRVGLNEADTNSSTTVAAFVPDLTHPELSGKNYNIKPSGSQSSTTSGHATGVARTYFGTNFSLVPNITEIDVYEANDFVLNRQGFNTSTNPEVVNVSVLNHSWIGEGLSDADAVDINARMDYTVNRDNVTSVVGLNNNLAALPQIYAQSYNSIVVGVTNAGHSRGTTTLGGAGRTKPDIVAPQPSTSLATAVVSSTAALLHSAAKNNLANARNSETMKAIIMAGATKSEFTNWSNTPAKPLHSFLGMGEVNAYNSYKILLGTEQAGSAVQPVKNTSVRGWDYGESIAAGTSLYWTFRVDAPIPETSVVLAWNALYQDTLGNYNGTLSLANMDMRFYNSSTSFLGTELAASLSTVDNVEHIYLRNLSAGTYTLAVTSDRNTQFGVAWNLTAVPEPSSIALVGLIGIWCSGFARYRRQN